MKNSTHILLGIVLCSIIFPIGSSSAVSTTEFEKYLNDPKALRVVMQVCVPDKTAYFETITVDVTDLPEDISQAELRQRFTTAKVERMDELSRISNQSNSNERQFQPIRLLNKPVNPTDYPSSWISISKVDNVKGIRSASSASGEMIEITEKNQPVFIGFNHQRPEDIIAVSVTPIANADNERITYWYKLPKSIPKEKYTDWQNPISGETRSQQSGKHPTFWLLTHDKELPIYEVNGNAPKVRYTVMTNEEANKNGFSKHDARAMNAASLLSNGICCHKKFCLSFEIWLKGLCSFSRKVQQMASSIMIKLMPQFLSSTVKVTSTF